MFVESKSLIWKDIFSVPFQISRETSLQSFQYKLIHRIIPCNDKLHEWRILTESTCNYCNSNLDNIIHFFLYCPKARNFWHSFFKWWNRLSDVKIPSDYNNLEENVLFGFLSDEDIFTVLNLCVLIAKFYLYKRKLFYDNSIDFYEYLYELKYRLQIEESICEKNNTTDNFKKYLFIYENL